MNLGNYFLWSNNVLYVTGFNFLESNGKEAIYSDWLSREYLLKIGFVCAICRNTIRSSEWYGGFGWLGWDIVSQVTRTFGQVHRHLYLKIVQKQFRNSLPVVSGLCM